MSMEAMIETLQQLIDANVDAQLQALGLDMRLEPMTAFTDAILATWTAILAGLLFARARASSAVRLWAWAFVAATVSSLAGVAYHGFRTWFTWPVPLTLVSWKAVPIATGVAALCLGSAAALVWLNPKARRVAITILGIEFAACVIAALVNNSFVIVAVDYAPVLLALLLGAWMNRGRPASAFIAAGVVVSFVAVGIQRLESWQYHNDVFHLIQMIAMYLLYRGGAELGALEVATSPSASATASATGARGVILPSSRSAAS
jgi:hypothetical protein